MGTGTSIGRVRGLGSAKEGSLHWWRQRLTAGTNLLLMTWFFVSLLRLPGFDHRAVVQWLDTPWTAVPMVLLIVSVFYHMRLGLQVVIEDYQHHESRFALMILLNLFTVGAAALAVFSVLKIGFGAAS